MTGQITTTTIYSTDGEGWSVRAFTSATNGVVVHESLGDPGWVVTHQRSGSYIAWFDNPEQAQAFAADLAPLADWQQSGAALLEAPGLIDRVRVAMRARNDIQSTAGNRNIDVYTERLRA